MSDGHLRDHLAGLARRLQALTWLPQAASALLLGAAAALLAAWHLDREEARLRSRLSPVEIVVAARALAAGAALERADLTTAGVPREVVPGGALVPDAVGTLEGRRLLIPLRAGDPLLASAVSDADAPEPLARTLSHGRRAVAVPIDPPSSVAGLIEPGDRVDAVLVWQDTDGESQVVTLLEALPVLAVGGERRPDRVSADAGPAVLEAEPAEAEALLLALDRGRVTLVLRGPTDAGRRVDRRAVRLAPLVPGYQPPAARIPSVEVIRGAR